MVQTSTLIFSLKYRKPARWTDIARQHTNWTHVAMIYHGPSALNRVNIFFPFLNISSYTAARRIDSSSFISIFVCMFDECRVVSLLSFSIKRVFFVMPAKTIAVDARLLLSKDVSKDDSKRHLCKSFVRLAEES